MNEQCAITDIYYGGQIYAYAPINEKGEPVTDDMDVEDCRVALADAVKGFYYCRNCGEEWGNFDEAKKHYEVAHAEAQAV